MDEQTLNTATTVDAVAQRRSCSRCDGEQHLVGEQGGFGKYRCDNCELVIGFDLEASPAEFLIERGLPGRYTKAIFGMRLTPSEFRLP